jgi:hypothetical protein
MTNPEHRKAEEPGAEERELAWLPCLGVGVLLVFLGLHRLLRTGFETSNNAYLSALAVGVILHLGPVVLRRAFARSTHFSLIPYSGWLGILLFVLLAVGFLSDGRSFARYGTYAFEVLCLIAAPFSLRRISLREMLVVAAAAMAFGFCAALDSWSGKNDVGHPLFDEEFSLGRNDNDIYFHATLAAMIQVHGVPSTGLHGIPYIPYHYGGQVIAAGLCNLTGVHPMDFYVVILVPLFYSLWLGGIIRLGIVVYDLCRSPAASALDDRITSWIPQLGILLVAEHTWLGHEALTALGMRLVQFNSQSYVMSVALVAHLAAALLVKAGQRGLSVRQEWVMAAAAALGLAVCGIVKISTMHVAVAVFGCLLWFSGWWRKRPFQCSFVLTAVICGALTLHFAGVAKVVTEVALFQYHLNEVAPDWLWLHPLVLWWPLWAGLAIAASKRAAEAANGASMRCLKWCCAALVCSSLAPSFVMQFYGGCIYYLMLGAHFSTVMAWCAISLRKSFVGVGVEAAPSSRWRRGATWAAGAWFVACFVVTTWQKLPPVLSRQIDIRQRFLPAERRDTVKQRQGVVDLSRALEKLIAEGPLTLPRSYRMLQQLKSAGFDKNARCRSECVYVPRENLPALKLSNSSPWPDSFIVPAYTRRCQIFGLSLLVNDPVYRTYNGFGRYSDGWDVLTDPPDEELIQVMKAKSPKSVTTLVEMNSNGKLVRMPKESR